MAKFLYVLWLPGSCYPDDMCELYDHTVTIPMVPIGKAINIFVRGGHACSRKTDRVAAWEKEFFYRALGQFPRQPPLEGPISIDILAVFPRTKDQKKIYANGTPKHPTGLLRHTVKPDGDNIRKSVQDALKFLWKDDCQVDVGLVIKARCELDGQPRVTVRVREITDEEFSNVSEPLRQHVCSAKVNTLP